WGDRFRLRRGRETVPPLQRRIAQRTHRFLRNGLATLLVIDATEELARVRDPFRRRLVHHARSECDRMTRGFYQAVELRDRELPFLRRAEEQRAAFAHRNVSFALPP